MDFFALLIREVILSREFTGLQASFATLKSGLFPVLFCAFSQSVTKTFSNSAMASASEVLIPKSRVKVSVRVRLMEVTKVQALSKLAAFTCVIENAGELARTKVPLELNSSNVAVEEGVPITF